jgi:hypothetical protein
MAEDVDDLYRRGLSNAPLWFTKGGDLLVSARVLWEKIEPITRVKTIDEAAQFHDELRLIAPFLLLCGLALENFLKALIVKQRFARQDGRPDPQAPTALPDYLNTHDLCDLANRASFEVSAHDRRTLLRLTHYIAWAGRYPIPRKRQPALRRFIGARDLSDVEALAEKLQAEYYRLPFQPFDRPRFRSEPSGV